MPAIPPSIQLPDTDRYRPWTLAETVQHFDDRIRAGDLDLYRPFPLGLPLVDECLGGGMHAEDLVLLGGMQNVGKTIVGLQAAFSISAHRGLLRAQPGNAAAPPDLQRLR